MLFLLIASVITVSAEIVNVNQTNFDVILDSVDLTFLEVIRDSKGVSELLEALQKTPMSLALDSTIGFARVFCTEENLPLLSSIHMSDSCKTDPSVSRDDLLLFQRRYQQYHILPQTVPSIVEDVVRWAEEEVLKPPVNPENTTEHSFNWAELKDEHTMLLSDDTFESFLSQNSDVVMLFYAEWCQFSQAVAPLFAEAAASVQGAVKFAKINVDTGLKASVAFNLKELPTIVFIQGGSKGGNRFVVLDPNHRTLDDIRNFALKKHTEDEDWKNKLDSAEYEKELEKLKDLANAEE